MVSVSCHKLQLSPRVVQLSPHHHQLEVAHDIKPSSWISNAGDHEEGRAGDHDHPRASREEEDHGREVSPTFVVVAVTVACCSVVLLVLVGILYCRGDEDSMESDDDEGITKAREPPVSSPRETTTPIMDVHVVSRDHDTIGGHRDDSKSAAHSSKTLARNSSRSEPASGGEPQPSRSEPASGGEPQPNFGSAGGAVGGASPDGSTGRTGATAKSVGGAVGGAAKSVGGARAPKSVLGAAKSVGGAAKSAGGALRHVEPPPNPADVEKTKKKEEHRGAKDRVKAFKAKAAAKSSVQGFRPA